MDVGFRSLEDVVYPEIEPGIINKEMIIEAYLDDGRKNEEARLHRLATVVFDQIFTIRLEFKNILRIDYLWIMPNLTVLSLCCNKIEKIEHIEMLTALTELNLSFNYIEKIENLEKLVKLEVLSLFNNLITKLENLEPLQNLIILSLGNNKIDTVDGIERFRFLPKLNVLNLEGNPIAQRNDFILSNYIAAILPNVKYYEYVFINENARKEAREKFYRELRKIEVDQEKEFELRNRKAKAELDAQHLSRSFVEYLNDHQLHESLWDGDDDGKALLLVGETAVELVQQYQDDMYQITQEIYKFGLEKYKEREREHKAFLRNVEQGHLEVQKSGHNIIDEYRQFKDTIFGEATKCLTAYEKRLLQGENENSSECRQLMEEFENISNAFNERTNEVWQELMTQELHLFETTEETTSDFKRNIQDMVSKFVEQEQTYFGELRDIAIHFSENLGEIVSLFISEKLATQQLQDVAEELKPCLDDKDAITNLVAGMKDAHTQRIDEREDRLLTRSREWIENLVGDLTKAELERNRAKILEINSFLEYMSQSLLNLPEEIHELVVENAGN